VSPAQQTRDIGTNWPKGLRSAVLVVPSAIIPQEPNCVLNPEHPDFLKIRFDSPEPFYFDDLLRKR
jgi:RES domain-containing protein